MTKRATITQSDRAQATLVPDADDHPITLAEACKLFPRAHLTVSALRAERDRGRLDIFKMGRRDCVTVGGMFDLVRKCREENTRRSPTPPRGTTNADGEQARSAAALSQITSALKRSA
jgi:hypothetical protein